MSDEDRRFPAALSAVSASGFVYELYDETGIEYEPFPEFLSADETTRWLRAWTGNRDVAGDAFRVFGMDGSGGHAAFWLIRPGRELVDQPVVFFGSEGALGVVATDLNAFLWLLACGFGPFEAVEAPDRAERPHAEFTAIAERFAPGARRSARELIDEANREFPDFEDTILALCRFPHFEDAAPTNRE